MSDADSAVAGSLSTADAAAQARAAAFEARSQEALSLINRGNGAANEVVWKTSSDTVDQALGRVAAGEVRSAYAGYAAAHVELRALDDGGAWGPAVKTSLGVQNTANGANLVGQFDAFDQSVSSVVTTERARVTSRLTDAVDPLASLRVLVLLIGAAAAALIAFGYGQRLKEYR
jgi:hypothetical protein